VRLLVAAGMLAACSLLLLGPASEWLARARWVQHAPRSGVLLWQCLGFGALLSGIGAGLALAVNRYHAGLAGGTAELVRGVFGGRPLHGLGLYDALGLTLAADLGLVLCVCFWTVTFRTIRLRARHRKLLDLVTYESPEYPGTELLFDQRPVAYCLPGVRPRIVLSDGALSMLGPEELWAVIHHERAHAHEHHGLVMLPMVSLTKVFGWIPYARLAPERTALLLEMAADDFSSQRAGSRPLASALVEMAINGWAPGCGFAAAGAGVVERVSRLLEEGGGSKRSAAVAVGLGIVVMALPLAALFVT
jgi:bla regulator protein blaR1